MFRWWSPAEMSTLQQSISTHLQVMSRLQHSISSHLQVMSTLQHSISTHLQVMSTLQHSISTHLQVMRTPQQSISTPVRMRATASPRDGVCKGRPPLSGWREMTWHSTEPVVTSSTPPEKLLHDTIQPVVTWRGTARSPSSPAARPPRSCDITQHNQW